MGGIHPNPGPQTVFTSQTFLQFNCKGFCSTLQELVNFLDSFKIKVACLQETKLNHLVKVAVIPNHYILRRHRSTGGGSGLIILIHHSVCTTPLDLSSSTAVDGVTEILAISANIDNSPFNV
jgi:exonuclease III